MAALKAIANLLIAAAVLLLTGCAESAEDRAFFSRGWVLPESGANDRLYRSSGPDTQPKTAGDRLDQSGSLRPRE